MASTVICQKPAFEFFQSTTHSSKSTPVEFSFAWDSSPYTDPAIFSDDSFLTSPTTPESPVFLDHSKQENKPVIKSEEAFDFGSFEDWMRWDEPIDATLSPISEFFPKTKTELLSLNMNSLEPQGSRVGTSNRTNNPRTTTEDSVVFIEDPVSEEPLFQSPATSINMTEIPPRQCLYSTPLSWSRPSLGQMKSFNTILSPQEEFRLREIAMPPSTGKPESYPASPVSEFSHEPVENNQQKRKSSGENDDEEDEEEKIPQTIGGRQKKTAHNMIEKRYRTNLNDKIAALRDSVPSLRVISKAKTRKDDTGEDLQGLTPAHKLNKATVLSKATEYIAHLEKRNKYLVRENVALKSRVDAFEILVMAGQGEQQQLESQQRDPMERQGSQTWMS